MPGHMQAARRGPAREVIRTQQTQHTDLLVDLSHGEGGQGREMEKKNPFLLLLT